MESDVDLLVDFLPGASLTDQFRLDDILEFTARLERDVAKGYEEFLAG